MSLYIANEKISFKSQQNYLIVVMFNVQLINGIKLH